MLWYRKQGAPPELAEVRGSACSHGVMGNCGAHWHRMLEVPNQNVFRK